MKNRIVFLLINSSENDNISIYDLLKKQLKILHFYESSTFREQNKNENEKKNHNGVYGRTYDR